MKAPEKILIVDDSPLNRALLADMLQGEYEILEASSGLEAVVQIERHLFEISLVLLDIVMPEMDGFAVLDIMNKNSWIEKIPVIIISAETTSACIDHAYDMGATEYISRPFDPKTVRRRVSNVIMLYSKQKLLENMVTEQMLEKEKSNLIMVEVLSHIVEFRNGESGAHVLNIRTITEILLTQLCRVTDRYDSILPKISMIANASSLHDIGKITIDEKILNKPGRLTPQEYEQMKTHSAAGAAILEKTRYYPGEELVRIARDICRWHHERYDGSGYPDGLVGEAIPIEAQVVALADVYDALTHQRAYKPAYSHEEALKMILRGECGVFNPLLLQCMADVGPELKRQLAAETFGYLSQVEVQEIARNLLQNNSAPHRTLSLLEQERAKYQFFAATSKEIQFEYTYHTDLLMLSEWGAEQLGLPRVIAHPLGNRQLYQVMAKEDYLDLQSRIFAAKPNDPNVMGCYCLHVGGQCRWHRIIARPLWSGQDPQMITGVIGKCTDIHDEIIGEEGPSCVAGSSSITGL